MQRKVRAMAEQRASCCSTIGNSQLQLQQRRLASQGGAKGQLLQHYWQPPAAAAAAGTTREPLGGRLRGGGGCWVQTCDDKGRGVVWLVMTYDG
jgi:hypothetical protein